MGIKDEGGHRILLLLKKARDGDPSSAAELVNLFAPLVITVLKRYFHFHRDDYQSIFNHSLFRFIREPWRFDPAKGEFERLLIRTARNNAADHLRKEKKHTVSNDADALNQVPSRTVPFFDQMATREEAQELRKKLIAMRPSCSALDQDIIDSFLNDEREGDWAKRLSEKHGVSANNVAQRSKRLCQKLI